MRQTRRGIIYSHPPKQNPLSVGSIVVVRGIAGVIVNEAKARFRPVSLETYFVYDVKIRGEKISRKVKEEDIENYIELIS